MDQSQFKWDNPDMEGSLLKKGHIRKNWKWRWFRLKAGHLYYFENSTDNTPLGVLNLSLYGMHKAPTELRPYAFKFVGVSALNNLPSYHVCAMGKDLCDRWMMRISQYTATPIPDNTQLSAPPATSNNVPKEKVIIPPRPMSRSPSLSCSADRHAQVISHLLDHISDDDMIEYHDQIDAARAIKVQSDIESDDDFDLSDASHSSYYTTDTEEAIQIQNELLEQAKDFLKGDDDGSDPSKGWNASKTHGNTKKGITGTHRQFTPNTVVRMGQEEEQKKLIKLQEKYLSQRDPFKVYSVKEKNWSRKRR
jgi:hypothetical protein